MQSTRIARWVPRAGQRIGAIAQYDRWNVGASARYLGSMRHRLEWRDTRLSNTGVPMARALVTTPRSTSIAALATADQGQTEHVIFDFANYESDPEKDFENLESLSSKVRTTTKQRRRNDDSVLIISDSSAGGVSSHSEKADSCSQGDVKSAYGDSAHDDSSPDRDPTIGGSIVKIVKRMIIGESTSESVIVSDSTSASVSLDDSASESEARIVSDSSSEREYFDPVAAAAKESVLGLLRGPLKATVVTGLSSLLVGGAAAWGAYADEGEPMVALVIGGIVAPAAGLVGLCAYAMCRGKVC
jgi:hypothetical protein